MGVVRPAGAMDWEPQGAGYEPPLDWGQGPVTPVAPASSAGRAPVVRQAAPSRYPTAREALHTVFGYDEFRGDQADIVEQVISGGDAVVLMPTGGGKSITYQVPALVREGTGLVISPLIALMHDQVDALRANGVQTRPTSTPRRRSTSVARSSGPTSPASLDLIYVAPERLSNAQTTALLQRGTLSVIAIDEAHCVSQWRVTTSAPTTSPLGDLGERFPGVPRMALTATATAATHKEITERAGASTPQSTSSRASTVRTSSTGSCPRSTRASSWSRSSRRRTPASDDGAQPAGIVLRALSRKSVEQTATLSRRAGARRAAVSRGSAAEVRAANQARFLREDGGGHGRDHRIRHGYRQARRALRRAHRPAEVGRGGTTQETGRAGRDGEPAVAVDGIRPR